MIHWLKKIMNLLIDDNQVEFEKNNKKYVCPSVHIISIKGDNRDLYNEEKIMNLKGNQFHFLIRRTGDVVFKDDFDMNEEELMKNLRPNNDQFDYLYNNENLIDGIQMKNEDEIRFSSEMVGIQLHFESSMKCENAIQYSKEIAGNLENKTNKEAELLLVINQSFIWIG